MYHMMTSVIAPYFQWNDLLFKNIWFPINHHVNLRNRNGMVYDRAEQMYTKYASFLLLGHVERSSRSNMIPSIIITSAITAPKATHFPSFPTRKDINFEDMNLWKFQKKYHWSDDNQPQETCFFPSIYFTRSEYYDLEEWRYMNKQTRYFESLKFELWCMHCTYVF